ncbi:histidine uptake and utilization operon protein HutD [Acinetobacter sp. NRRL B-65365]|uniref:HutD/Ves family protein n=1 Tax=Acinetobacter sp. NRRL B-65365 TaxID=1785092 RepID=UPI00079FEF66|nr:HutD family protein [Acinetobacter sp. NRRL B-65365]KYQ84175.1 histidine uptake and utilization operon protein HutD [Acinetobacter sp. NRRL B-65365]
MIKQLSSTDYRQMLWKNGAGYTVELARSAGENLDTFDWRISMADVKSAGDFSRFNGMQRILTVLEGQGIELYIDDEYESLTTLQSVQFSGESATRCELIDGPIRDFNLIYDPKQFHARLQWYFEPTKTEIFSSADLIFIFNQSTELLDIEIDGQIFQMQHQESLYIEQEKSLKKVVLNPQILKQTCLIELIKI